MNRPLVSCLMVTRDRRELAARAVDCFVAQTWQERELVIVDDGDEDYSPMLASHIARGHRIRYERIEHDPASYLGALRNRSLDLADGEWCIQWDDDEWYHPHRIERQMHAVGPSTVAVALRWTLMAVESEEQGSLAFRSDTGFATPGTVLHRREPVRYANLARGEDSQFLRALRRHGDVAVLGDETAHLFVRCFHGSNTWDERHFLRRLHRRAIDWPAYAWAAWVRRDLRRHPAFHLDAVERSTIEALRRWDAAHTNGRLRAARASDEHSEVTW